MKRRTVIFASKAENGLLQIFNFVAERAGPHVALPYVRRIKAYCDDLGFASERGQRRDDLRVGLRTVGFAGRATIVFSVNEDRVTILRVFAAGRNWETEL